MSVGGEKGGCCVYCDGKLNNPAVNSTKEQKNRASIDMKTVENIQHTPLMSNVNQTLSSLFSDKDQGPRHLMLTYFLSQRNIVPLL